jgi:hypothetical protein
MFVESCNKIEALLKAKSIRRLYLYTSIDTWGEQATYVRHGMNLSLFQKNIDFYLEKFPDQELLFMVTFNIFSLARFSELLDFWLSLKNRFNGKINRIKIYINILTEPIVFSYLLLPDEFALKYFDQILNYLETHYESSNTWGFNEFVANDIKKVRNDFILQKLSYEKLIQGRQEFVNFFRQYDQRKGLDLLQVFPEYADLFESWGFKRKVIPPVVHSISKIQVPQKPS